MVRPPERRNMDYKELNTAYYELYRKLQAKYNLREHRYDCLDDDSYIHVYQYEGLTRGKLVVSVREETIEECLERAIEQLKHFDKMQEEGKSGRRRGKSTELPNAGNSGKDNDTEKTSDRERRKGSKERIVS